MLLAGIGWGVYALANQALSRNRESFHILIPLLGLGTLVAGPAAALRFDLRASLSLSTLVGIVFLGCLCTGGAFYLLSEGIKRLSAAMAGTLTNLSPLFSVLLAHLVLHESLPATLFVAAGLIVGGIFLIAHAERCNNHSERAEQGSGEPNCSSQPPCFAEADIRSRTPQGPAGGVSPSSNLKE
jgi:DME family drug/metabolite transporter